eukprot:1220837-Rhodomonas_salina.1
MAGIVRKGQEGGTSLCRGKQTKREGERGLEWCVGTPVGKIKARCSEMARSVERREEARGYCICIVALRKRAKTPTSGYVAGCGGSRIAPRYPVDTLQVPLMHWKGT